jgi:hypothetical protein
MSGIGSVPSRRITALALSTESGPTIVRTNAIAPHADSAAVPRYLVPEEGCALIRARIGGEVRQFRLGGRTRALAALAAVGVLGSTGAAYAAAQTSGASYRGKLAAPRSSYMVSFRVSANGRQVTHLEISNLPFYCSGGGRPIPVRFANATISRSATFTSTGRYVISEGPLEGQVGTQLKITGKFAKHGSEHGTLTSTYPKTPTCSGTTTYTTKG